MARSSLKSALALLSVALGSGSAIYNMLEWQRTQLYFGYVVDQAGFVLSFYEAEALAIFLIALGIFLLLGPRRSDSPLQGSAPSLSSLGILRYSLSQPGVSRVMMFGSLAYGLLYALASNILVFQPWVDFGKTYGVSSPSWAYVTCCGDIGTVPKLVVYLSPGAHLALQLVPLSLLLLAVLPPLVGLNLAIAAFSVRSSVAKLTGRWMVACGAFVGLFTACPTCAGLFLAESVGGIGATTLAVALAPYQTSFIAASIPLLLLTPFAFVARLRRAWLS